MSKRREKKKLMKKLKTMTRNEKKKYLRDFIWHSKEGDIRLGDMETSHIQNCIKFLKRKGFNSKREFKAGIGIKEKTTSWLDRFDLELRLRVEEQEQGDWLSHEFEDPEGYQFARWDGKDY